MFKNALIYVLPNGLPVSPEGLGTLLQQSALRPCTAMSMSSVGWVASARDGRFVVQAQENLLITLAIDAKVLPAACVRDLTGAKVADYERRRGFKPGRKALREIKEQAVTDLLPRALVRRSTLRAWIDLEGKRLVVDAASTSRAELLVETLRLTLGELSISMLPSASVARHAMTRWVSARNASPFALGNDCELTSLDAERSQTRFIRQPVDAPAVRERINLGMAVTRLELLYQETSFITDEAFRLKRIRFAEGAEADPQARGDGTSIDADLLLLAHQLKPAISALQHASKAH